MHILGCSTRCDERRELRLVSNPSPSLGMWDMWDMWDTSGAGLCCTQPARPLWPGRRRLTAKSASAQEIARSGG
jgi:hypothetical protein